MSSLPSSRPVQLLRVGIALAVVVSALAVGTGGVVAQSQSGQVIGQPDISFGTASGEVSAGTATDITVTITNRGKITKGGDAQYEDRVTTARAMTLEFDDDRIPVDVDAGQLSVGNVPTGVVQTTVPLTVNENVEPGTYELPIEYEYQYTAIADYDQFGVEYGDRTRTREGSITVEVTEDARFEVVETNGTAQVGDDRDISITLKNTGTEPANDASVTASASAQAGSVSIESGSSTPAGFVGDWDPGETRTVTYSMSLTDDAPQRNYPLSLEVNYEDTDGIAATSRQITAGIASIPEQSFAFEETASSLRVGEEGDLVGTVTNTGPTVTDSVVVRYADDSETVIPVEKSVAIGSLAPGESADFRLPIEISSEGKAGAKSLDMAVRYRNQEGNSRSYEKLDISATVSPKRDQFEVALLNQTIETGSTQTISVTVTSNLDEPVEDVEGKLFADDPLTTGETDTGFIKSLDPGETMTLTFEVTASGSAMPGKTFPISFDFRYDDADGDSRLSDPVRVPIEVVESEEGGLPISLLIGAVGIVGSLVAIWWYRRQ